MDIKRTISDKLLEWKTSGERRPLIIQGARQIGKTWVVKDFGKKHFTHFAYFNFDSNDDLCAEFLRTKDIKRLIHNLSLYSDAPIIPGETLIFFDEIQECNSALASLKYFCEETPEYHIIAAGSLLGVALHENHGFPVGKVEFLNMYPLSFREYFSAYSEQLGQVVDSCRDLKDFEDLPPIVVSNLEDALRHYRICGGLPRVAVASLEHKGNDIIAKELNNLLLSYSHDFSKHAPQYEVPRISYIWESLPSQLAKENRKFLYKVVRPGARAREYESSLNWLKEAGLIYQVFCSSKPGLPLAAYDELSIFKIYMFDCGLLRTLARLPADLFRSPNRQFVEFKGAIAENLVLQQLVSSTSSMPRYWVSDGIAEVDFIMQSGLDIIPIEIKSGSNSSSRSLSVYIKKYQPSRAIVISEKPLSVNREGMDGVEMINLPAYLCSWIEKIL